MTDLLAHLKTIGSGSYAPEDVQLLLQPMQMQTIDLEEKERLIQTQKKHYSEMISWEAPPTELHQQLYAQAVLQNGQRMASEVQSLAQALKDLYTSPHIALVSLVRAGLPLGVLLRRALLSMGRDAPHYAVSIIRDRGIDPQALEAIIQAHGAENIVFVDGWTGKGAIANELQRTLSGDKRFPDTPRLVVLADPCGRAWLAASAQDWLIPSGILGATVSGLVSRSIWPAQGGLHGCITYPHLREYDVTRSFIEQIETHRRQLTAVPTAKPWSSAQKQQLNTDAVQLVQRLANRINTTNLNRIKPGIAEATRAVLRRVPEQVLVRDLNDPDVQLLMYLTQRAGVQVEALGAELGPYRAVTLIRGVKE